MDITVWIDNTSYKTYMEDGYIVVMIHDSPLHKTKNVRTFLKSDPFHMPTLWVGEYEEEWVVKGKLHREDGPALITWSEFGDHKEEWRLKGLIHRNPTDGFALSEQTEYTTKQNIYGVNGVFYSDYNDAKEAYANYLKRLLV